MWWHSEHATDSVNAAVSGGVSWVWVTLGNLRLQGNAINASYDVDRPPVYLPGKLAEPPWTVSTVLEMARRK